MSGCIEECREYFANVEIAEKRNEIAAVVAGTLFFSGWWFAIDATATDHVNTRDIFHIFGVLATISMIMINVVPKGQLEDEYYVSGFLGGVSVKIWFFVGFLMGFGSLLGGAWILFGEYVYINEYSLFRPVHIYPGVAFFMQNIFIFASSIVYRFGRTEELWG